ncbi:MAG: DinB family protein [Bryobacterales bacterium]|nr:DinB family protein [Bryobacterales bacterium]MBV9401609.1 DinB family protein [Bryobacterales bacterium]
MHKLIRTLLVLALAACAFAQGPQPAQDNPMSTWLRQAYTNNRNNIVRTAEKMPEEFYDMRPGSQMEVRTFGQQVGHVANFNFLWCSQAKGEKNPNTMNLEKLTTKAEFIKAANDAFSYCDGVYSALTDASGAQVIDITQENGRQTRNLRLGLLTLNYGHNNEIYGSMVVYLRMKNLVPPASEPRGQQKK